MDHQGLRTRAAALAAAADRLAATEHRAPFRLAFLTDRRRIATPQTIIRAMRPGGAVIYRDYDDPYRGRRARELAALCRARSLVFLVSSDPSLAKSTAADGVHLPGAQLRTAKQRPSSPVVTGSCHNVAELERAAALGLDAVFLSPAFATESHPGADALGPAAFKRLAAYARTPTLALGGVDERNAWRLRCPQIVGFGAIGAFAARPVKSHP